ncbi:MAG: hypothetical protein HY791_37730 [Deltaproteobacteria bacterium]|nr:hypothetical protein [Deltaproteobacteria bacterium]
MSFERLTGLSALAVWACAACASDPTETPDAGVDPSLDAGNNNNNSVPPAPQKINWTFKVVDEENAGFQPEVAVSSSGRVGIAYFRSLGEQGVCSRVANAPIGTYAIMYAEDSNDFTPEEVIRVDLLNLNGISLAFDDSGNPAIAFMGGAEGAYRCGGTDVMLARKSGAAWTTNMVDSDGMATPVFQEDVDSCAFYQNTCNAGGQDVVGPWPALAFASGQPAIAYRDIHFGFAQDDEEKSDLELSWNGRFTLDATWGGGNQTRMTSPGAGRLALVHASPYGTENGDGIWVMTYDGSSWARIKVSNETDVGYRIGLATRGDSIAVAYHARSDKKAFLVEGTRDRFGQPSVLDQTGDTGRSPSLAYDESGRLGAAFYRCGPYRPDISDCSIAEDALVLGVRGAEGWKKYEVRAQRGFYDGTQVALAFKGNSPVIAFQAQAPDPAGGNVVRQMVVAQGVFE